MRDQMTSELASQLQRALAPATCSAQRTDDMANLRITIKIEERRRNWVNLAVARWYLQKMKNPNREPLVPNVES